MSHDEMLRERLARLAQGVDAEIEPALARALRAGKGRRRRAVVLNAVVGAGMVAAAVLGVVRVVTQPEAARFDAPRDSKKGQPFFLDCGGLDVGAIYPPAVSADGRVLAFVSTLGKDRNPTRRRASLRSTSARKAQRSQTSSSSARSRGERPGFLESPTHTDHRACRATGA